MSDEFFSFDEALDELRLKEEELKRLVSEGEIRAFRKGDTMKLRRSDVEALRAELSTGGEVVDLGDSTEELVFEDDADDDAGMATQEIADVETIIEDDVEELDLEEDDEPVAAAPVRRASVAACRRCHGHGCGRRCCAHVPFFLELFHQVSRLNYGQAAQLFYNLVQICHCLVLCF